MTVPACRFCRALNLFQPDHCGVTLASHDKERLIVPVPITATPLTR